MLRPSASATGTAEAVLTQAEEGLTAAAVNAGDIMDDISKDISAVVESVAGEDGNDEDEDWLNEDPSFGRYFSEHLGPLHLEALEGLSDSAAAQCLRARACMLEKDRAGYDATLRLLEIALVGPSALPPSGKPSLNEGCNNMAELLSSSKLFCGESASGWGSGRLQAHGLDASLSQGGCAEDIHAAEGSTSQALLQEARAASAAVLEATRARAQAAARQPSAGVGGPEPQTPSSEAALIAGLGRRAWPASGVRPLTTPAPCSFFPGPNVRQPYTYSGCMPALLSNWVLPPARLCCTCARCARACQTVSSDAPRSASGLSPAWIRRRRSDLTVKPCRKGWRTLRCVPLSPAAGLLHCCALTN